jgi:glycosyltransferase involved in cell wall biosynthesis
VNILFLDAFHGGSHAAFARGFQQRSAHAVELLTLPGVAWRWRMRGAAVTFARQTAVIDVKPDVLLATDMLDLATFLALTRASTCRLPVVVYFHENQLTYPVPANRQRDRHLAFTNVTSALAADLVLFNSEFHRADFLRELPSLLKQFPDEHEFGIVEQIAGKSAVIPVGVDLQRLDFSGKRKSLGRPVILWNSRWDYDKGADFFFQAIDALVETGEEFDLIIAGENTLAENPCFDVARERYGSIIRHFGYSPSFEKYAQLLWEADIVVFAATQEFFGVAAVEAIYCGCIPLMPHRLNYPYLIPSECHESCTYRGLSDLIRKLRYALHHREELRRHDFRSMLLGYDWPIVARSLDARLEALAR